METDRIISWNVSQLSINTILYHNFVEFKLLIIYIARMLKPKEFLTFFKEKMFDVPKRIKSCRWIILKWMHVTLVECIKSWVNYLNIEMNFPLRQYIQMKPFKSYDTCVWFKFSELGEEQVTILENVLHSNLPKQHVKVGRIITQYLFKVPLVIYIYFVT